MVFLQKLIKAFLCQLESGQLGYGLDSGRARFTGQKRHFADAFPMAHRIEFFNLVQHLSQKHSDFAVDDDIKRVPRVTLSEQNLARREILLLKARNQLGKVNPVQPFEKGECLEINLSQASSPCLSLRSVALIKSLCLLFPRAVPSGPQQFHRCFPDR